MPGIVKTLATITLPPNGQLTTVYTPGANKTAIVGKIIIASSWPARDQEGYDTYHMQQAGTSYNEDQNCAYVRHVRGNNVWYLGYPQGSDVNTDRGYNKKGFLTTSITPTASYGKLHDIAEGHNRAAWAGAYSLFRISVNNQPISTLLQSPHCDRTLEINQGIPLAHNQALQITNGLTDYAGNYYRNNFRPNDWDGKNGNRYSQLLADHRARANHLVVTLFGQEHIT